MKPRTVTEYIASAPAPSRKALRELRALIKSTLPRLQEKISYRIAGFVLGERYLLYMAGWEKHVSLYPVTAAIARSLKREITPYRTGKGTLQFSLAKPIPKGLIRRIVKVRARELDEARR
jgi:uncharacterized protein YdhG (YjbR/CyaY superfamily)